MKNLIDKIKELNKQRKVYEIEELIEQKLKNDPNNIEWWLKLAILEIDPPIVDNPKSIACVKKALAIEPNNATAILLLAFLLYFSFGSINDELLTKLQLMKTESCEMNAMLRYTASRPYFMDDDRIKEEQLLKESIRFYDRHVWNHVRLARLYLDNKKIIQAQRLAKKALQNVKKIYGDNENNDPTDIDIFLNEHIKGIELTDINYESIQEEFGITHNFGEEL